jgi:hypothetical protein
MLDRILVSDIQQALTPERLSGLLSEIVRHYEGVENSDITVFLKKEDRKFWKKLFSKNSGKKRATKSF